MNWSVEEVTKLAPKATTLVRGRKLAVKGKWQTSGKNESAIWGECKGSGSKPYRTIIDLNGPAYNCSCPSREFPCKHALGLFLLAVQAQDNITTDTPPDWTDKWLGSRAQKASPKVSNKEKTAEETLASKTKKAVAFEKKKVLMLGGLDDLDPWLNDLVREGLASVEKQPHSFWNNIAARMVDAQLSGIAKMIRRIPFILNKNPDWPETICYLLGDIHLLSSGVRSLERLSKDLQAEVLSTAGRTVKKDDVIAEQEGVKDAWVVLGQISGTDEQDENINWRRVWLYGANTGQYALLLDFFHSFSTSSFPTSYRVGTMFDGVLCYYPGQTKMRVALKMKGPEAVGFSKIEGHASYENFLQDYAKATGQNPWLNRYPVYFTGIIPIKQEEKLWFLDTDQKIMPTQIREDRAWKLLAISGGESIDAFGEWADNAFLPLAAIHQGQIIQL